MKVFGITGNSGSGKSTAVLELKKLNCEVIDLDKIGHSIYENEFCFKEINEKIKGDYLTNSKIDRKKLGKIVFSSKEELEKLTKITDKYIYNESLRQIENIKNQDNVDFIILDGALILDSQTLQLCDEIILVEADFDVRLSRILKRDNLEYDDAFKRLNSQKNYLTYEHIRKHIVYNNLDNDKFNKEIQKIIQEYS